MKTATFIVEIMLDEIIIEKHRTEYAKCMLMQVPGVKSVKEVSYEDPRKNRPDARGKAS